MSTVLDKAAPALDATPSTAPPISSPATSPRGGWMTWLLVGLVLLGYLPLLVWHFGGLLQKPHYQFIVFLPIGIWLLVQRDESAARAPVRPRGWVGTLFAAVLLVLAMASLGIASYAWSPWLGAVSALVATFACLWWACGQGRVSRWLPAWVFCWLLIPPPFGMDEDLIVRLRGVTTRMTSAVLDQLGILHLSYANVIELPGKKLFIADACSGIHSLYVLMAAALFLGLFNSRSVVHIVALLVSTFGIVLFENVARLVAVAWGLRWQRDLSAGPDHMLLGAILFCFSLLLVLTTDQLLMFLLPQRPFRAVDWLLRGLGIRRRKRSSTPTAEAVVSRRPGFALMIALACLFPLAAGYQLTRLPAALPDLSNFLGSDFDLPAFGEDFLPEELAGFQRVNYEQIDRVPGDPFGQASQQWTYRNGDLIALISLDYPYEGHHDATLCYTNTGWTLEPPEVLPTEEGDPPVGRFLMSQALQGNAVVYFSSADLGGHHEVLIKEQARGTTENRAASRFRAFGDLPEVSQVDVEQPVPPYLQFQLLGRSHLELDEAREAGLLELFKQARELLYERCLQEVSSP